MKNRPLAPEATLDLRIQLDKLRRLEDRCRAGLEQYVGGRLTREDYLGLLDQHAAAERSWRSKHERYIGTLAD